jgi:hypothetical protein
MREILVLVGLAAGFVLAFGISWSLHWTRRAWKADCEYAAIRAKERRNLELDAIGAARNALRAWGLCPRCGTADGLLGIDGTPESSADYRWCDDAFHAVGEFDRWPVGEAHARAERKLIKYGMRILRGVKEAC